ncbi:hypothetical protein [Siminovitchia fortis]|uniref:hypothetical protein n=1 Tax=Siminovitchia fortis TaxID=254758 RepID=UPI0016439A32|nr:hypothetical protein [Siminovitchia fortis]
MQQIVKKFISYMISPSFFEPFFNEITAAKMISSWTPFPALVPLALQSGPAGSP